MDHMLLSQNLMNQEGEELDEDVMSCVKDMNHPREAFFKARDVKDEGNKLFRNGDFGQAIITYEKAYQFLSVGEPLHDHDVDLMMDLATSLSLNLAACGLKVGDFDKTVTFSSYALEFDPKNIKALFRRALAFVKLDRLDDALKDLGQALEVDPSNQEVSKELKKIEKELGNTSIQLKLDQENPARFERQDYTPKGEASFNKFDNLHESNLCSQMDEESRLKQGAFSNGPKRRRENQEESMVHSQAPNVNPMSCVEDRTSPSPMESPACPIDEDSVATTLSPLTFRSKKKMSGNSLSLSKSSYDLLLKGKKLEFYDPTSMSLMQVRIRTIEPAVSLTPTSEETRLSKEDQQTQRESQVQQQSQELEKMTMEKQGDEVDCTPQVYKPQEPTTSNEDLCNGMATTYCPKKFKRLKLTRIRCHINLSITTKERHQPKSYKNRHHCYSTGAIMKNKRKQEKVIFEDAQNQAKRRLGDITDHYSALDIVGCSCMFLSACLCKNYIAGQVDVGDAMAC